MRKGFTLVEMSIVLVIIGLVIGGILVAQSMVNTLKITQTISDIQQFDAGVTSFMWMYKNLPGDAPAFGGDGNGLITSGPKGWGLQSCAVYQQEIANFWPSLNPQKWGNLNFNHWFSGGKVDAKPNINVPQAKLGKSTSIYIASAVSSGGVYNTANLRNYYTIYPLKNIVTHNNGLGFNYMRRNTTAHMEKPLQAEQLASLDLKIDDGIANEGGVRSGSYEHGFWSDAAGLSENGLPNCNNGAVYRTNLTTYECMPIIRIGMQAGSPQ